MAAGFGCYRYWYIRRTVLIRCLGSLAVQRGVFFKTTIIIDIHRLKGYAVKQSSVLRMLQLVDLALTTKDREYPVIWIRGVPMADIDTSILEYIREKGEKKTCKRL
jgi:membrane protein YdbS with pleckstrin-like domain